LLLWHELEQEQLEDQQPLHEQEDEHEHEDQQPEQLQLLPNAGASAPLLRAIRRTTLYIAHTSNNTKEPSHTRPKL